MTKVIEILQGGYIWHIPAEAIAKHRATYYAANDPDTNYDEEYKYTLESDEELNDWFLNNMNLSDVEGGAVLIKQPSPSLQPDLTQDFKANVVHVND